MKDAELRLIVELMKDCRRSDRNLAKAIGVSQPTVTRMIKKLEKEGFIRWYSMVPDFSKLGFDILAFTFAKLKRPFSPEQLEKGRKAVREVLNKESSSAILGMSGIGLNADRVLVTFHEDYAAYANFQRFIRDQSIVEVDGVQTFVVDLSDRSQFLQLNFAGLAGYILKKRKEV